MVDNPKFIDKCEKDIWDILDKMHKEGSSFQVIHWLVSKIIKELEAKAVAEHWLNQDDRS